MKDRLKAIRNALKLSQQEFADRIGLNRNTLAGYEIGKSIPIDPIILSICREYSINETWLRTGEGEMFSSSLYDELDKVVEKYHLNDKASEMLRKFVELSPEEMEIIYNYMEKVVLSILEKKSQEERPEPAAFGMTEEEIQKAGEEYMSQLRLEKRQAEGSLRSEDSGSEDAS